MATTRRKIFEWPISNFFETHAVELQHEDAACIERCWSFFNSTRNASMAVWDVCRLALQFFMTIPAVKKAKRSMAIETWRECLLQISNKCGPQILQLQYQHHNALHRHKQRAAAAAARERESDVVAKHGVAAAAARSGPQQRVTDLPKKNSLDYQFFAANFYKWLRPVMDFDDSFLPADGSGLGHGSGHGHGHLSEEEEEDQLSDEDAPHAHGHGHGHGAGAASERKRPGHGTDSSRTRQEGGKDGKDGSHRRQSHTQGQGHGRHRVKRRVGLKRGIEKDVFLGALDAVDVTTHRSESQDSLHTLADYCAEFVLGSFFQRAERQQLKQRRLVLSKPPQDRTEEEIDDLMEFVQNVPFLTRFALPVSELRNVCRQLTCEEHGRGSVVFEQGQPVGEGQGKFYLVLHGQLDVRINIHMKHYEGEATQQQQQLQLKPSGSVAAAQLTQPASAGAGDAASVSARVLSDSIPTSLRGQSQRQGALDSVAGGDVDPSSQSVAAPEPASVPVHVSVARSDVTAAVLTAGHSFGEASLLPDPSASEGSGALPSRSSTVVAVEKSTLAVLDQRGFARSVQRFATEDYRRKLNLLRRLPLFVRAGTPLAVLERLARAAVLRDCEPGQVLVQQGQPPADGVFLVRKGEFRVLQEVRALPPSGPRSPDRLPGGLLSPSRDIPNVHRSHSHGHDDGHGHGHGHDHSHDHSDSDSGPRPPFAYLRASSMMSPLVARSRTSDSAPDPEDRSAAADRAFELNMQRSAGAGLGQSRTLQSLAEHGDAKELKELKEISSKDAKVLALPAAEGPSSSFLDVTTLQPFSMFGEIGVLLNCARTASVVAKTAGQVLQISKADFRTIVDKTTLAMARETAAAYPSGAELLSSFQGDTEWLRYRRAMSKLVSPVDRTQSERKHFRTVHGLVSLDRAPGTGPSATRQPFPVFDFGEIQPFDLTLTPSLSLSDRSHHQRPAAGPSRPSGSAASSTAAASVSSAAGAGVAGGTAGASASDDGEQLRSARRNLTRLLSGGTSLSRALSITTTTASAAAAGAAGAADVAAQVHTPRQRPGLIAPLTPRSPSASAGAAGAPASSSLVSPRVARTASASASAAAHAATSGSASSASSASGPASAPAHLHLAARSGPGLGVHAHPHSPRHTPHGGHSQGHERQPSSSLGAGSVSGAAVIVDAFGAPVSVHRGRLSYGSGSGSTATTDTGGRHGHGHGHGHGQQQEHGEADLHHRPLPSQRTAQRHPHAHSSSHSHGYGHGHGHSHGHQHGSHDHHDNHEPAAVDDTGSGSTLTVRQTRMADMQASQGFAQSLLQAQRSLAAASAMGL